MDGPSKSFISTSGKATRGKKPGRGTRETRWEGVGGLENSTMSRSWQKQPGLHLWYEISQATSRNEFPGGDPARSTPTSFRGSWEIGRHGFYFSDVLLRKSTGIFARFVDSCKRGGGLGYFVLCVAVTPAESSLKGRVDEQDSLVLIVQLKVKLKSEVLDLGGREGKRTVTACPQLPGELWQSKQQGQRERDLL